MDLTSGPGAGNKTISVKPMPDGDGWQVQVSGKRERMFMTKADAVDYADSIMRVSDTLKIFKETGGLQRTKKGPRA